MNFSVKITVPCSPCKSIWQLRATQQSPMQQQIKNFINLHQVTDVAYVEDAVDLAHHDMHVLTVNRDHLTLDHLVETVIDVAAHSRKYLWVSVNKFFIYQQHTRQCIDHGMDWDLSLLDYMASHIPNWKIIDKFFRSDDRGQLGNFQYPVTALAAEKS